MRDICLPKGQLALHADKNTSLFARAFNEFFLIRKAYSSIWLFLPNFINNQNDIAIQSLLLSGIFITICLFIYGFLGTIFAYIGLKGGLSDKGRRYNDGIAGSLLTFAAVNLALN